MLFRKSRRKHPAAAAPDLPIDQRPITDEAVIWASRLLLGREPTGPDEIALHQNNRTIGGLRTTFLLTPDFDSLYVAAKPDERRYRIPYFLLRSPADATVPWRFRPPSLASPISQFATAAQFDEPVFRELVTALDLAPRHHRKVWEHAFIIATFNRYRLFAGSKRVIGFGCGRERLPAYLAARGLEVLATDAPEDTSARQGWSTTNQFAKEVSDLYFPRVVDRAAFDRLVTFRPVDMNVLPSDLAGQFDACWSACSLEHLGSLKHGLDFIESSLEVLKPGGIAVHTTEFNLSSDEDTVESKDLSIFRRRDIESLIARLIAKGHNVAPLNTHPGDAPLDEVIDIPPYGDPHLKLRLGKYTVTSVGLAIRRAQ